MHHREHAYSNSVLSAVPPPGDIPHSPPLGARAGDKERRATPAARGVVVEALRTTV